MSDGFKGFRCPPTISAEFDLSFLVSGIKSLDHLHWHWGPTLLNYIITSGVFLEVDGESLASVEELTAYGAGISRPIEPHTFSIPMVSGGMHG